MIFYNEKIFKRCFHYKGKYWYKNIKEIPLYFRLIHHLIKYGYDEYATWETFNWFIDTMKSILPQYHDHMGVPIVIDDYTDDKESENEDKWHSIIDRMIELLALMDEKNYFNYESYKDQCKEMNAAKDEFFELFAKYFYNLWD